MRSTSLSFSVGSVRQWHWISSALCLAGMLLFAITGITLNHAGQIESSPSTRTTEQVLPDDLLESLRARATQDNLPDEAPLPEDLRRWLSDELSLRVDQRPAEWSADEIYLSQPRPGGDAWLSIDLPSGELIHEATSRGWISWLNDLHKGRNTGVAWSWFIDLFSAACVVFCISGLILLSRHSGARPLTWPLTGMGLLIPVLLALLFVHQ